MVDHLVNDRRISSHQEERFNPIALSLNVDVIPIERYNMWLKLEFWSIRLFDRKDARMVGEGRQDRRAPSHKLNLSREVKFYAAQPSAKSILSSGNIFSIERPPDRKTFFP